MAREESVIFRFLTQGKEAAIRDFAEVESAAKRSAAAMGGQAGGAGEPTRRTSGTGTPAGMLTGMAGPGERYASLPPVGPAPRPAARSFDPSRDVRLSAPGGLVGGAISTAQYRRVLAGEDIGVVLGERQPGQAGGAIQQARGRARGSLAASIRQEFESFVEAEYSTLTSETSAVKQRVVRRLATGVAGAQLRREPTPEALSTFIERQAGGAAVPPAAGAAAGAAAAGQSPLQRAVGSSFGLGMAGLVLAFGGAPITQAAQATRAAATSLLGPSPEQIDADIARQSALARLGRQGAGVDVAVSRVTAGVAGAAERAGLGGALTGGAAVLQGAAGAANIASVVVGLATLATAVVANTAATTANTLATAVSGVVGTGVGVAGAGVGAGAAGAEAAAAASRAAGVAGVTAGATAGRSGGLLGQIATTAGQLGTLSLGLLTTGSGPVDPAERKGTVAYEARQAQLAQQQEQRRVQQDEVAIQESRIRSRLAPLQADRQLVERAGEMRAQQVAEGLDPALFAAQRERLDQATGARAIASARWGIAFDQTQEAQQRERLGVGQAMERRQLSIGYERQQEDIGIGAGRQLADIGRSRARAGRDIGIRVADQRVDLQQSLEDQRADSQRGLGRTLRDIDIGSGRSRADIDRQYGRGFEDIVLGQIGGIGGQFLQLGVQRGRALEDVQRQEQEAKVDVSRRFGDTEEDIATGGARGERGIGIGAGRAGRDADQAAADARVDAERGRAEAVEDAGRRYAQSVDDLATAQRRQVEDFEQRAAITATLRQRQEEELALQTGLLQVGTSNVQAQNRLMSEATTKLIEQTDVLERTLADLDKALSGTVKNADQASNNFRLGAARALAI